MTEKSNNCLVSVVIPAYNAEKTLGRAIQSVLDDRYPFKEILIVDDGSTDATRVVAEPFLKNSEVRVRLIELPHGGANKARNAGLRQSEGVFVQFLDADDWLINDKLQQSIDLFCSDDKSDICLVYTGKESINSTALASGCFSYFTHGINTVAAMWKREFLIEAGLEWDEDLQCWQEAEFYFRALVKLGSAERIRHLPGKFYERDTSTAGISSKYFSEGYILAQNMAINRIYAHCQQLPQANCNVNSQPGSE